MNSIEAMLYEQMQSENFHQVINDDFGFVDSLIEQSDLDKITDEEDED